MFPKSNQSFVFVLLLLLLNNPKLIAEGTKELLPIINTTDTSLKRAIVTVGGIGSGTCAAYGGNPLQRITIEINDAFNERIFLGFNVASGGPGYFRVFEPSGNPLTSTIQIPSIGRGFIPFFKNAVLGPDTLTAGGYSAIHIDPIPGVSGKYFIEFNSTGPAITPSTTKVGLKIMDITVANITNLQAIAGRVSSASWNINAGNIADYNTTFDGKVYVLTADDYVVSADFKDRGFAPSGFRLNFNAYGTQNTGNIFADRRSRIGDFMSPQFQVYLNNPDSILHPNPLIGQLSEPSLSFIRCKQNEFKVEFDISKSGIAELIYDANNNGIFDYGTADKRISAFVNAGQNSMVWNGLDGNGNLLPINVAANFILHYSQGYINFPIYDAEVDSGGVLFANVRPVPSEAAANLQFYDDTLLQSNLLSPFNSNKLPTTGVQYPYQEFNGCPSPCHKWEAYNGNNTVTDFGNLSTVNTYLFATHQTKFFSRIVPDFFVVDAGTLQTVCTTDTIQLNGTILDSQGNIATTSFQWVGGGTFLPNDSSLTAHYIPSPSELASNSFYVYLKLSGECSAIQDSVRIILNEPPSIAFAGSDQLTCFNSALLQANQPGKGNGAWSILSGNGSIVSVDSASTVINNLQSGNTTLCWKVSNGACPSSSDTIVLSYTPVSINLQAIDTNYCTIAPLLVLSNSIINAQPPGGSAIFLIDGTGASSIDPSLLSVGQHKLTVAYTEPINGQCIATDSLVFTIGGSCNKAPVAVDDYITISEDSTLNGINILLNDTDPNPMDTLTLQVVAVISPSNGTVTLSPNGNIQYVPNLNYFGSDFFTYQVCDTANACDTATVYIVVNAVNDAPVAISDSASGNEDALVNGFVLVNDFDVELNTILLDTIPFLVPQNGTVVLQSNGSFSYTPNLNYFGLDSFTYKICDNGNPAACALGLVSIKINPVNDAPLANYGQKTILEDIPNALNVLSNDFDVDGNLNPSSLNVPVNGNPMHGSVAVDASTNKIIYTPQANYFGNDTIIYEVCDTGFPIYCDTAYTFITVLPINDAPSPSPDFATLNEDNVWNGPSLLANDIDIDNDSLFLQTAIVKGPFQGSASLNAGGTYSYTPSLNYNGIDYFIYSVCDNGTPQECEQDTVFLTITAENDAPIATGNTVVTALNTSIIAYVLGNDFDVDGNLNLLSLNITAAPLHGSATVNPDGSITYIPQAGFFGSDSLIYSVCDNGLPALCASAYLYIDIGFVNLPPVCNNDTVFVNEDSPISIYMLSNDTDPNNNIDQGSIQLIQNAAHGTNTIDFITGSIQYNPVPNYYGFDTLVYVVCDAGTTINCDTAQIFITVQAVNDLPVAGHDSLFTDEDLGLIGNLITNDFDVDPLDVLSITPTPITNTSNGTLVLAANGTFNYTPNANFNGIDNFIYEVCDNAFPTACSFATATIIVKPINDAPVALNNTLIVPINSSTPVYVLNNVFDVDANLNAASLQISSFPSNGVAVLDSVLKTISYTPNTNFFGLDTVIYTVCDSAQPSLCVQALLIFNVGASNNPPTAQPDFAFVPQNNAITIPVLLNDFDVDGNINSGSVDILVNTSNGTIILNAQIGTITYQPNLGFSGNDTLVYEICDGGLPVFCDTAIVVITVAPNLAPVANSDSLTAFEDNPVNGISLIQNDTDPEGGMLLLNTNLIQAPQHGTIIIDANGTFTYFPSINYFGKDSLIYEICDNGAPQLCDTALLIITVVAINDAPIAVNDSIQMAQNVAYSGNLISNDLDVDSPVLLAVTTSINGPLNGTLFLANSGVYTYTPNAGYSGSDFFQYVVCDTGIPISCDTGAVFIQVGLNQAPVAIADFFSINEDTQLINASVISNDFDPDGASLIVSTSPITAPLNGTLVLNSNGQFVYTPFLNFNGSDSFTYSICDGGFPNLCDTAIASIQITAVNDVPQAVADSFVVSSNSALTANVAVNDTDVETVQLTVNPIPILFPQNGTIALSANGQFSYTPNTNFIGIDSFAYSICDAGFPVLCDSAMVYILVKNRTPIAVADSFAMTSGGILNANCILNDSDPEGGTLKINTLPLINVTHGSLSLSSSGTFVYEPQLGFTGIDFFFYTVCDSGAMPLCANAKVTILVRNTAPLAINDTVYGTAEASINGNVISNDTDAESSNLVAFILSSVQQGTLLFKSNGDFEYQSVAGYSGVDLFSYVVCDDGIPSLCDTAFVFISINETIAELIIPNAFSPNGDNINDVFEIKGIDKYPNNEIQFFDRNGLLIYSATGYRNFWTGIDKWGNVLENGSYFYVLDKKDGTEPIVGYVFVNK